MDHNFNYEMDESGVSMGFDISALDNDMVDINELFPDELLAGSPPEMEAINYYEIQSKPAPVQSPSFKSESVTSRTHLRQQLMKDQLLKEKERQREAVPQLPPISPAPHPIKVPSLQNVALPQHVLHVTTGLQNPTKYHILEKQKNQVLQFLSTSQKEKANFGERETYSAPVTQKKDSSRGSRASASFALPPTSPGMQSFTSGGTSDAEEVIDTILSYEENSDARARSTFGSNASLESVSHRLKSEPNSYEESGKERVKKETHNMIERRRRYNINDRIKELGDLLPQRNEPHYDIVRDSRANKGTILKSSVDYIKVLKEDANRMKQMEQDYRQLQLQNRKLMLRIQHLEIKAQEKGIPLEEKMWKPATAEDIIAKYVRGTRSGSDIDVNSRSRSHMPDILTDAACLYDDSMDSVASPDPMLSAAAAVAPPAGPRILRPPARPSSLSPSSAVHMDTE